MPATPTLDHLRRYAVARSLFEPTSLPRAIARLGFVQVDPIRAPARAQDLTLRHRVDGYRAGDLERPGRRSGKALPAPARRGGFLRQLRHPAACHPVPDAPADGTHCMAACPLEAGGSRPGVRAEPRRGPPARRGCRLRARHDPERVRRQQPGQHAATGRHALPRPAARGAARKRDSPVCAAAGA